MSGHLVALRSSDALEIQLASEPTRRPSAVVGLEAFRGSSAAAQLLAFGL